MEILFRPTILAVLTIIGIVFAMRGLSRSVAVEDEETSLKTYSYSYDWKAALKGGSLILVGVILFFTLVVVQTGHRGVTFSQWSGISHVERDEGMSLQLPFFLPLIGQNTTNVSVQEQLFEIELPQQTKDLQEVKVPVGVNFVVDPDRAAELYQDVGSTDRFGMVVIKPAVEQIVKAEVGLILAEDFAAARNQLAIDVGTALTPRLAEHGVTLTFLSIEDAVFQPEFITAVQNKVVAEQEAQRQFNLVAAAKSQADQAINLAEGEKQSAILVAEGEKQAIEEIAAALGFTPAEYLEWVLWTTWTGAWPDTVVGGEFGVLLEVPGGGGTP